LLFKANETGHSCWRASDQSSLAASMARSERRKVLWKSTKERSWPRPRPVIDRLGERFCVQKCSSATRHQRLLSFIRITGETPCGNNDCCTVRYDRSGSTAEFSGRDVGIRLLCFLADQSPAALQPKPAFRSTSAFRPYATIVSATWNFRLGSKRAEGAMTAFY
jgi:hypothetical protein